MIQYTGGDMPDTTAAAAELDAMYFVDPVVYSYDMYIPGI